MLKLTQAATTESRPETQARGRCGAGEGLASSPALRYTMLNQLRFCRRLPAPPSPLKEVRLPTATKPELVRHRNAETKNDRHVVNKEYIYP
jgi:hypothetical protein